jgi:hypothetical protein
MASSTKCPSCKNDIPPSASICPHCGFQHDFPNVIAAKKEQASLEDRYKSAVDEADVRGSLKNVEDFENALLFSRAVINRPATALLRLLQSENELYATYYQLSATRLQNDEVWDSPRQSADAIFFTGYQHEIRFGALSLDLIGLTAYGDCCLILRENLIAHRASLVEQNTAEFVIDNRIVQTKNIPKGLRSTWIDRGKLGISKLAKRIDATTSSDKFPDLLLTRRSVPDGRDDFVEVHIFGQMTIRTVEEIAFTKERYNKAESAIIKSIKEKAKTFGVKIS